MKVALEIIKRAQHCVLLIHMLSCSFEIVQIYLRLAGFRVYKGHLQNELSDKNLSETSKK